MSCLFVPNQLLSLLLPFNSFQTPFLKSLGNLASEQIMVQVSSILLRDLRLSQLVFMKMFPVLTLELWSFKFYLALGFFLLCQSLPSLLS